jgi:hypothetical protein
MRATPKQNKNYKTRTNKTTQKRRKRKKKKQTDAGAILLDLLGPSGRDQVRLAGIAV